MEREGKTVAARVGGAVVVATVLATAELAVAVRVAVMAAVAVAASAVVGRRHRNEPYTPLSVWCCRLR